MNDFDIEIPFQIDVSISDALRGVFRIDGTLARRENELSLKYRGTGFSGKRKFSRELDIGIDDLRDIVLKRRPWGLRIILHPKRLATFAELPGDTHDRIVLKLDRSQHPKAQDLVATFREALQDRAEYDFGGIPFSLPDVGVSEIRGVIYLEPGCVVLEIVSGLPGITKRRSKVIRIETRAVRHIRLETGKRKDALCLASGPELLEAIPGKHENELRLRIARRYRDEVQQLLNVVADRQSLHI